MHAYQSNEHVCIILELCYHTLLDEAGRRHKGRFTSPATSNILLQVLEALKYLHGENIIHRDIKPGNIFLCNGMTVKLADFGYSTWHENGGARRKTICGTPNYMAPVVISSGCSGYGFEADIWSLEIVM